MATLVNIFESLSKSVNKDLKDGRFLEWILSGIPKEEGSSPENDESPFMRARELISSNFPSLHLLKEDEEMSRRHLKITLFTSYFASVKHGWQPLKKALLGLKVQEQRILEKIFSYLLEEKWEEELLELKQEESSEPQCPSSYSTTTPISRFKKASKCSSSPSSFQYSPHSAQFHPLKDFFSSPVTTQISKYQRIAEDQKRLLSLMRLELDQEKLETLNLMKEREELSKERVKLKKALASAKQNLLDNEAAVREEVDDEAAYEEIQKRLAEKKDSEKYIASLEEQLGEAVDVKEEFQRTVANQRTKLEERSIQNAELDSKNIQLQVSLNLEKEVNSDLSLKCSELEVQVKELQEILESRRASGDKLPRIKGNGKGANGVDSGVSVADISIDDPMMSLPSSPEGENMAEALVIPELEEKLAKTIEERDGFKEKMLSLDIELVSKSEETTRISNQLKEISLINEKYRISLEDSENQKIEIQNSLDHLSSKNDSLQKNIEQVTSDFNTSKESVQRLSELNKTLEDQLTALNNDIQELRMTHSQQLEFANSQLNSIQTSLQSANQQNKILSEEIENYKCKESNYANEALERESKIISAEEEIKNLRVSYETLQTELKGVTESMHSKITELSESVQQLKDSELQLTSEKKELLVENSDLKEQLIGDKNELEKLKKVNFESLDQVELLKGQITSLNNDFDSSTEARSKLEEKVQNLESCVNNLEDEKTKNLEQLRTIEIKNTELLNLNEESKAKMEKEVQGLLNQNKELESQLKNNQVEMESLASKLHVIQEKSDSNEGIIISQENQLKELTQSNEQLKIDLKTSEELGSTNLSEVENKLTGLNKELGLKVKEKIEEVNNLQEKIKLCNNENQEINQKFNESQKECEAANKVINSLKEESASALKKFDSEIDEFKDNLSAQTSKISSLENELKRQNQMVKDKDAEIESLTSQLKEASSQDLEMKQRLEASREHNNSQEATLSSLQETLKNCETEVKQKEDIIQDMNEKNVELKKQVSDLVKERNQIQESNDLKVNDILKVSDELKLLQSEVKSRNEELDLAQSENAKLQSELSEIKTLNNSLKTAESNADSNLAQLKTSLSAKEEEISKVSDELKLLQSEVKSKNGELDLAQSENAKLQSELSEIKTLNNSLKTAESNADSNLAQLKTSLSAKEEEISKVSDEFKLLQSEVKSKNEELDLAQSENAKLQSELSEIKTLNNSLKTAESNAVSNLAQLKTNLSAKEEEMLSINSQLEKDLGVKKSEYDNLLSTVKDLKTELNTLQASFDAKVVENTTFKSQIEIMKSQEHEKTSETLKLQNVVGALKEEAGRLDRESKSEIESLSVQVQELSGELDLKNKTLHDLRKEFNDLMAEKSSIESTNKQLTADIGKALNAVDKCEKEVTEINHSLPALENENCKLKEELGDLKLSYKNLESEVKSKSTEYENQLKSYKDQLKAAKEECSSGEDSFENKLSEELRKLKNELETKSKDDLAAQKARYETRVKAIAENVSNQYKGKLEQFSKEKDLELDGLSKKTQECEKKYNIAKVKISELVSKLEEMSRENDALQKKYNGSKDMIFKLKEEKEGALSKHSNDGSLSVEIETLKRQLAKVQTENRQLNVQFSTAELKIRSLQKEVTSLNAQQTNRPILPSCRGSPQRGVFKVPTSSDTPGRTRNGRTQSESHFHSRRPPNGVGALFNVDDEEGEMFSNSYLSDVKEGRCAVNENGRLSELSRRNTLQPSHLKSSYPIETQFYDMESFKENDLKEGKVKMDVQSITKGTANLSMNSPAMNTRSRRTTIGTSSSSSTSHVSPLSTRKRAVLDNSSFNSNSSSFIMRYEAKRSRGEAQQTSYSKPGPPTPAKNKSFHSNSSMNESSTSEIAGIENSPSLRSQSPNVSNRSLRSRIVDTPLTLKRALKGTWRRRKSYNMKGKVDENTSVVVLDKGRTPLKRLDKRK